MRFRLNEFKSCLTIYFLNKDLNAQTFNLIQIDRSDEIKNKSIVIRVTIDNVIRVDL